MSTLAGLQVSVRYLIRPILKLRHIQNPRNRYSCHWCMDEIRGSHLYGFIPGTGPVRLHSECASAWEDECQHDRDYVPPMGAHVRGCCCFRGDCTCIPEPPEDW